MSHKYIITCKKCGATRFIDSEKKLSRAEIEQLKQRQGACVLCLARSEWGWVYMPVKQEVKK